MLYDLHNRLQTHLENPFLWTAMLEKRINEICVLRIEDPREIHDFVFSLLASISLSPEEKKRILETCPKLSTDQIHDLRIIFYEERVKFDGLIRNN